MSSTLGLNRRTFVSSLAGTLGLLSLSPTDALAATAAADARWQRRLRGPDDPYDLLAKVNFNENPYGPTPPVLEAMTHAFKFANRYNAPDNDIVKEIAAHHGVKPENIVLGAGSGEILDVMGSAYCSNGKTVVGSDPSYGFVYSHVSSVRGDAILVPLTSDYRQDIPALISAVKKHYRSVGYVYLCNPNNPTGRTVSRAEVKQLVDAMPDDMPILIDEAYFHFVEDPDYGTSVQYALDGRPVVVTRTFSKIAALAGMRLGYAITQPEIIAKINPYISDSINAIVKWGGVAALKDTAAEARVKQVTIDLRKKTSADLRAMGYEVIPSETNFFMVGLKRPVKPVIDEFKKRGVMVGRPFPPLNEHLRVSIGTADEMRRFTDAFREIMSSPAKAAQ